MPDRMGGESVGVWIDGAGNPANPANVAGALRSKVMPYTTVRTGELVAGVAPNTKQCPDIPCDMVKIKLRNLATGYVHIGWNAAVSMTDGIQDTRTGFVLGPGDDTGWILISNMSLLYYVGSVNGDRLTYIALGPN